MQINPITTTSLQYSLNKTRNINNNNTDNISFSGKKHTSVNIVYPRRYLPEHYQVLNPNINTYDSFTGLRDKNYLLKVISKAILNSEEKHKDFSVAMFDMDNFKSINELLGYKTGDSFIKTISGIVEAEAKKNSIHAYRFGGEEFVIVFNGQSSTRQKLIAEDIINKIHSNEYLRSEAMTYRVNAKNRLIEYETMHEKIKNLIPLKAKRDFLKELLEHFETKEAKHEPYFIKCMNDVNKEIETTYATLLDERIEAESTDKNTQALLKGMKQKFDNHIKPEAKEIEELDEYLLSVYDKSLEIHQLKKWIANFDQHNGFSITGGVVCFSSKSLSQKNAIDVINEVGEVLKHGKTDGKGQIYFKAC